MTIPDELIKEVMQEVIDKFLKPRFIELGMNASGSWLAALEARVNNGVGEIWGKDYTYYLANGRRPGKRPPIDPIVQWVGYKLGIRGQEATGIAYAISNKIAKEGTKYYPNGTDIIELLSGKEVKNYIYSRIRIGVTAQVNKDLNIKIREIFK